MGGHSEYDILSAGVYVNCREKLICSCNYRLGCIRYRDLKVIRVLSTCSIGSKVSRQGHKILLRHVYNQAVAEYPAPSYQQADP